MLPKLSDSDEISICPRRATVGIHSHKSYWPVFQGIPNSRLETSRVIRVRGDKAIEIS